MSFPLRCRCEQQPQQLNVKIRYPCPQPPILTLRKAYVDIIPSVSKHFWLLGKVKCAALCRAPALPLIFATKKRTISASDNLFHGFCSTSLQVSAPTANFRHLSLRPPHRFHFQHSPFVRTFLARQYALHQYFIMCPCEVRFLRHEKHANYLIFSPPIEDLWTFLIPNPTTSIITQLGVYNLTSVVYPLSNLTTTGGSLPQATKHGDDS